MVWAGNRRRSQQDRSLMALRSLTVRSMSRPIPKLQLPKPPTWMRLRTSQRSRYFLRKSKRRSSSTTWPDTWRSWDRCTLAYRGQIQQRGDGHSADLAEFWSASEAGQEKRIQQMQLGLVFVV